VTPHSSFRGLLQHLHLSTSRCVLTTCIHRLSEPAWNLQDDEEYLPGGHSRPTSQRQQQRLQHSQGQQPEGGRTRQLSGASCSSCMYPVVWLQCPRVAIASHSADTSQPCVCSATLSIRFTAVVVSFGLSTHLMWCAGSHGPSLPHPTGVEAPLPPQQPPPGARLVAERWLPSMAPLGLAPNRPASVTSQVCIIHAAARLGLSLTLAALLLG
jgi:hypothetical protein